MLKVEEKLIRKRIWHKVIALNENARTVEDVVKFSKGDIAADEICKTIIIIGKKTGKTAAVLLKGLDRIYFKTAKNIFGEEMAIASPEVVKEVSGVEPGAVCPFLLTIPLYIDKKVLGLKKINSGSGDHLHGLEYNVEDIEKVVSYKIISISKT